ncbi:acyl-CoA dehydrogenase family protein [Nocardioides zeae]|uniref:Acyl-CoA dehydrogenase family protein n=1 Tax=Nocardioides imazamoxiresistens TaxID=3231893 RepID=A0ABU3PQZ7_9ACTN|nr:acyl-CoA dehydrogenase family protein [Nocardioides zeae]MDT9591661.1 acyl-CoA dehydrogenase family protein [Nocardioides zeae]
MTVTAPTSAPAATTEPIGPDERAALADLAFGLGRRYQDRRFADLDAARDHWKEVCDAGLPAISLSPEHGGAGTMSDLLLVAERLAAGGYPAGKLTISTAIGGAVILRHGSEEQRSRWLPAIGDGSLRFCFALTEPGAGSNAANMRTTATRTEDGWRIDGEKTYISAADDSDVMLVVAKDAESGGFSILALPLPCEQLQMTPVDVHVGVPERQWTVYLDDVRVPHDALVGRPGGGARALFDGLNPERLIVAAQAVGIGRWCLEKAAEYAGQRVVFGVPIGTHQAVQHPLAEALVDLEAAWALIERGAEAYEAGGNAGLACNMAKVKACDAGLKAADAALQSFGGSGFTGETLMFERFGYLRLLRSTPVSREMALNQIAVAGLGLPRSY